jgi:nucleolar protein 56
MYLITKWFGTFLCDKNGIKKEILFPKDELKIVNRLKKIDQKYILSEEKKISKGLDVIVHEKRLQEIGEYRETDPFFNKLTINPEDYSYSQELFHKVTLRLAQEKLQQQLQSEDLHIIQMVNTLDDLIQTLNLFSERLNCWSILPSSKEKIKPLQNLITSVTTEINRLEQQIDDDMHTMAPNTSSIVGPLIGARLVSLAGGLYKLAILPASTIQILGAEKALFRYKKEGGKPPKHGVIFQHPLIYRSSRDQRGKIARILANNLTIAVKADVFTKKDISKQLHDTLEHKVNQIRNK